MQNSVGSFLLLIILWHPFMMLQAGDKYDSLPREGNFALPTAQQPGPLASFGGNILDKGDTQIALLPDFYKGQHFHEADLIPSYLYAFTDQFTLYLVVPYALNYRGDNSHSQGVEDSYIQFEYAFFERQNQKRALESTIVVNATFPTGSTSKSPELGYGAMSYFVGGTYNYMAKSFLLFTSQGILWPQKHHGNQAGYSYFYQFGADRVLGYETGKWIFAAVLECDGTYNGRDISDGQKDPNSGGNLILFTPSLWFSTKHVILQLGVGFPIQQHLLGQQNYLQYYWIGNISWTFLNEPMRFHRRPKSNK